MTWDQFNEQAARVQASLKTLAAAEGGQPPPKEAGVLLLYLYLKKRGELPAGNRPVA